MSKLYVGNLSFRATEDQLETFVREQGIDVEQVNIIRDMHTGRSRGFGFIQLTADQDLDEAISGLNGKELEGRSLRVDRARERSQGGGGFRGRGGGGGGGWH